MASQNILLLGATGQIGTFILNAILSARDQFHRIAIFTSPHTAQTKASHLETLKQQNVEVIVGSIEDGDAIQAAYEGNSSLPVTTSQKSPSTNIPYLLVPSGIDTVISALGRNSLAQQIPLIRLAAATPNVKWFLPSEYGTDIAYSPASAHEKPHQQKLKVRAVLESEISRSDLEYSYVVTGPFADMYLHFTPGLEEGGGWDVEHQRAVLLGKGDERVSLTTMKE